MKLLVIAEQRQGKWNNTSFETLVAAQQIAAATSGTVSAAIVGKSVAALAEELATKDVAEVLLVEHELLESYTPDGYCTGLKQVIEAAQSIEPDAIKARWETMSKVETFFGTGIVCGDATTGIKHHVVTHPLPFQTLKDGKVVSAGFSGEVVLP